MLSQEVEEQLAEHLVKRIEDINTFILKKIGGDIKYISTLKPSQAYQLGQILKYGGSYNEIAKELAKVSGKNVQDIYKIFEEVAKSNKEFAKDFYKYRNMDFIPYSKDYGLQSQVNSIATLTANTYLNIANTSAIGLIQGGEFKQLKTAYQNVIDKAILSIVQGKEDYYSLMRNTLKELGGNGLVQYENGYTRRLDSAVRMNILDGMRQLNNETSKRFGKEYGADGVEISVHAYPAPDHADIQGRQFSDIEFEKLEIGDIAKDYKGNIYDGADKRRISEYNCYHKIFPVVLGVSEPEYTDKELRAIQEENELGFEYNGKHYTMYEGTQLQRRLELEARKQKDTQILARASGDIELAQQSQKKINQINFRYNELCKASGLMPKKQRMSVSGYRKIGVSKEKNIKDKDFNTLLNSLRNKQVEIEDDIINFKDTELRDDQLRQLDYLTDKYNHNAKYNKINPDSTRKLKLRSMDLGEYTYGKSTNLSHEIILNDKFFKNKSKAKVIKEEKINSDANWHYPVPEDKMSIYTITHEYGHTLEYEYFKEMKYKATNYISYKELDKNLRDTIMNNAISKLPEKITITEFKKKYLSKYAISKRNNEWFAETFTKYMLSNKQDVWTEAFGEWLEGYFNE